MEDIKLNKNDIEELLKNGSVFLDKSDKSLELFDEGNGLELVLNWQGYGYRPSFLIVGGFEYDENIKFTESEE